MREVLPARHSDQALVTGAEFYAQYGVWAHKLIPFPQLWRLGIFFVCARRNQSLCWAIYFDAQNWSAFLVCIKRQTADQSILDLSGAKLFQQQIAHSEHCVKDAHVQNRQQNWCLSVFTDRFRKLCTGALLRMRFQA